MWTKLDKKSPNAIEKTRGAFNPCIAPVKIAFRGGGEQTEQAHGIRAISVDHVSRVNNVALGFRHLGTVFQHHSLSQEITERLFQICRIKPEISQNLGEETGVQQVQNGVFHSTDILINRQPVGKRLLVEGSAVVARIRESGEIPGGLHKRIHCIGFTLRRSAATGTDGMYKRVKMRQRRASIGQRLRIQRQQDRELLLGNRHHAALFAIHNRNRRAPETLTGNIPVAETPVDGLPAPAHALQRLDNQLFALFVGDTVELPGIDHDSRFSPCLVHCGRIKAFSLCLDDYQHVQPKLAREIKVTLIMRGYSHDRPRSILGQNEIAQPDGNAPACEWIEAVCSCKDTIFFQRIRLAIQTIHIACTFDERSDFPLVFPPRDQ